MPMLYVACALFALFLPTKEVTSQKPTDPVIADFQARIEHYVKLRKKATKSVPDLKKQADAATILAHEQALAAAIRKARVNAKRGDIITPAVQKYLHQVTMSEARGSQGVPVKETIKQGNPPKDSEPEEVKLKVNAVYPKEAPKSSMPASLLERFPKLPEELEYRFVGKALILRDVSANIIVDYAPEVGPAL